MFQPVIQPLMSSSSVGRLGCRTVSSLRRYYLFRILLIYAKENKEILFHLTPHVLSIRFISHECGPEWIYKKQSTRPALQPRKCANTKTTYWPDYDILITNFCLSFCFTTYDAAPGCSAAASCDGAYIVDTPLIQAASTNLTLQHPSRTVLFFFFF